MWRILKSELSDKKYAFLIGYGTLCLCFFSLSLIEEKYLSLGGSLTSMAWNFPKWAGGLALLVVNQRVDSQTDRLLTRLPISLTQQAMIRLAPGVILLMGLGILFYLSCIVYPIPFTYPIKHQLWLAGLLLSFNAIVLIAGDINQLKSSNSGPNSGIFSIICLCYYFSFWMRKFYFSAFDFPNGDFVLFGLFLTTYFFSIYVFSHRKSYLV